VAGGCGLELRSAEMWCMGSAGCLTLPSFIPLLVALALAGDNEQSDEDIEPCVEEGPDDVVTMTLKREASIRKREFSRRWELDLSSQLSSLAPALLLRSWGSGGFAGRIPGQKGLGASLPAPTTSWAGSGASDLAFTHVSMSQPYSVVFPKLLPLVGPAFGDEGYDFMAANA